VEAVTIPIVAAIVIILGATATWCVLLFLITRPSNLSATLKTLWDAILRWVGHPLERVAYAVFDWLPDRIAEKADAILRRLR
jgi:hypothetical protein